MTDILKTLDDSVRKSIADKRKRAEEHPSLILLEVLVGRAIDVFLLRRIALKLGIPMTRLQAYALIGIFGRDPGFPFNLLWERPVRSPVSPEVKKAADKLAKDLMGTIRANADRITRSVEEGEKEVADTTRPFLTMDDVFPQPRTSRRVGDAMTSPGNPIVPRPRRPRPMEDG